MRIFKFVFDVNLEKRIQKKQKNMTNKCYSSMISAQNGLKTRVKKAVLYKKKCVDSDDLFKQNQSIK